MRTTFVRRNAVKLLATVALVAGAASVAGVGTFGAYTDTTSAESAISSGKVSVLMNGTEQGVRASASDMVPGDSIVFPVTIQRAPGSSLVGDLSLRTTITGSNALTSALRMSVDSCTKAWVTSGSTMTCPGSTYNLSTNGPLGSDGPTSGWGQTSSWVPTINSGTPVHLRVTMALPSTAGNETAGLTTSVGWTLTGTQQAGTAKVVTPSALS